MRNRQRGSTRDRRASTPAEQINATVWNDFGPVLYDRINRGRRGPYRESYANAMKRMRGLLR